MKKLLCLAITFVFCIGLISVPVSADDYVTYKVNIIDNGDGTVTVAAYAPANVYSGKLVLDTTADLTYLSGSAPSICTFNDSYNKNGITGICISFASAAALSEDTLVYTGLYSVADGSTIGVDDVYSYEWNLTNGDSYVGNQNNGGVDVAYVVKTYTVKFYGLDNQLLKEETVVKGESATAPSAPFIAGYTFQGWDKSFANVSDDISVYAQYKINTYTVSFVAGVGGSINGATSVSAEHGTAVSALSFPNVTADEGYVFSKWDHTSDVITANTTITAIFVLAPAYVLGDVNNDGYIDNMDAALILKYDSALVDGNEYILNAGDVNKDGYIDNMDAAMILKYDAGIIEGF